jgi:protein-tyrosine-phosphatase
LDNKLKPYNILFLCTHNSARSVLGEALATTLSKGKFIGYSAGSHPGTEINPFARELALEMGYDVKKLRSKSWDEYAKPDAPIMDFIITVCDDAADEECPVWSGHPATAHWGFPDPSAVAGTDIEKKKAVKDVMFGLRKRIELLVALPIEKLDTLTLNSKLKSIHQTV